MTWEDIFIQEQQKQYFQQLMQELEQRETTIYPPKSNWYTAFNLCAFSDVKVVLIGQDPYINENQAHGLSFSVLNAKTPPSLLNIKKELQMEFGYPITNNNNLSCWAKQGVLLLNRVLTVDAQKANSHKNLGWEIFTKAIIEQVSFHKNHVVFILLGNNALECKKYIDEKKHKIIEAKHPSPLSAYRGFFGSNIFIKTNEYLKQNNLQEINWEII